MTATLKSKYYIRVASSESTKFESHLDDQQAEYVRLSLDLRYGTVLYSVDLDSEEALSLRLSMPTLGFMNFKRTLGKLKETK